MSKLLSAMTNIASLLAILALTGCGASGGGDPTPVSGPSVALSNIVAFMGDSITQRWDLKTYTDDETINFGVSGQTTYLMMERFQNEVVNSDPGVVVILGGINDLRAGVTVDMVYAQIADMAVWAEQAHIKVILCSVLPYGGAPYGYGDVPDAEIRDLNQRLLMLAKDRGYLYADYYDEMVNEEGNQEADLFISDHTHPNDQGYVVMWGVLAPLLREDLG